MTMLMLSNLAAALACEPREFEKSISQACVMEAAVRRRNQCLCPRMRG